MVSGTFILTDTMQKSFDGLFTASYDNTDAVISGKEVVKNSTSGSGVTIPAALLDKVRALPEVEAAAGEVSPQEANVADIIGRDGKKAARESIGGSIDPASARFSPLKLKTGALAQGPRRGRDRRRHRRQAALQGRRRRRRLDPRQAARPSASPAPSPSAASTRSASRASPPGTSRPRRRCSTARAATTRSRSPRQDGTSPRGARAAPSSRCSPPPCRSRTAPRQAKDDAQSSTSSMTMIRMFLLGFGGIALLVGAFVIFNTLSITVAQRTREFATLRTLGASRKQVMRSVRARGPRHRPARVGDRAGRRARDRQGHDRPVQRPGRRPARGRARSIATRTIIVSLIARHRRSRCSPASCRRGARPACRRSRRSARARRCRPAASRRTRTSAGIGVTLASLAALIVGIFAGGLSGALVGAAARRRRARAVRRASRCSRRASSSRSPASSAGRRAASAASPVSWPAPTPSATPAAPRRPPPRS